MPQPLITPESPKAKIEYLQDALIAAHFLDEEDEAGESNADGVWGDLTWIAIDHMFSQDYFPPFVYNEDGLEKSVLEWLEARVRHQLSAEPTTKDSPQQEIKVLQDELIAAYFLAELNENDNTNSDGIWAERTEKALNDFFRSAEYTGSREVSEYEEVVYISVLDRSILSEIAPARAKAHAEQEAAADLAAERFADQFAADSSYGNKMDQQKVLKDVDSLITLNPTFADAQLDKSYLLDSETFEIKDLLDPSQTTSFSEYYSKKTQSIRELFMFFQRKLEADLKSKKKNLKVNGVDFDKHLAMIEEVPHLIKKAGFKHDLIDPAREDKYQISFALNKAKKFLGIYIFMFDEELYKILTDTSSVAASIAAPSTDGPVEKPAAKEVDAYWIRSFIPASDFEADSPLKSKFFNFTGYLEDFEMISKLGKTDLTRAENKMNCGFGSSNVVGGFDPLLDYVNFSRRYHYPNNIGNLSSSGMPKHVIENSRKRAKAPVNKSAKAAAIKSGTKKFTLAAAISDRYTVVEGDTLVPTGDNSARLTISVNTVHNRISGKDVMKLNKELLPTFRKNYGETKNAFKVGMVINIPKNSSSFRSLTAGGRGLSASVEDIDTAQLQKIWNEAFMDPFFNKLCPATLPLRVLECLLPNNCREMIEYIGLWRVRSVIEKFIFLDFYDDAKELGNALEKWDALIESKYNFKAVEFNGNGLLKSGTFDSKEVYPNGPDDVSVSFQARTTTKNQAANADKTKMIFMQRDSFEIKKTPTGRIQVVLYSPEGKVSRYTSKSASLITDEWRSLGFSWAGNMGQFTLYSHGKEVETTLTSGNIFVGPLAAPTSTEFIIASEDATKSQKGFAGQLDEIAVFDKLLSSEQWKSIAKIDTDINLKTLGLSSSAKTWWRMGDAAKDLISTASDTGKIIDLASGMDLTAVGPEDSAKIIVARLFKDSEAPKFIDIINRETDIEKFCEYLNKFITGDIEVAFDPKKIKRDILRMIKIPTFSKDPHEKIELVIKKTIVENLLRMLATFLIQMLEKALDCEGWKDLTKSLIKGSFNSNDFAQLGSNYLKSITEEGPLGDFISATRDPEKWNAMMAGTEDYFLKGITNSLADGIQMHTEGSNGEHKYTTLGLGQVQFKEEHEIGSEPFESINGTTVSIHNAEPNNPQTVLINLVKKTSQTLPPDSMLALFASSADPMTVATAAQILNSASDEIGMTFSNNDTEMFFGSVGSSLGLQDSIDQLMLAVDIINQKSEDPEFCTPAQNLQDRLGDPKTDLQKALDKASVQSILDQADAINDQSKDDSCAIPVPLSAAEAQSLNSTIRDVFSPVTTAYDSDLILYRLAQSSVGNQDNDIKKVFWKGDTETVKTADESGNIKEETIEIEKTVINPEFESMLKQGFVPLKDDGSPDGSRVGGVVKINWNPLAFPWFEDEGFLTEIRPPKSLSPTVDGDKVTDPDVEIKDLGSSLGPYTDYDPATGGSAVAKVPTLKVNLGGNVTGPLSANMTNFLLSDKNGSDKASYFSQRQSNSQRGIKNIITKSRTSLIPPPKSAKSPPDARSKVTHMTPWGRSLEGNKFVSFTKTNPDPIFMNSIKVPFNLSSETRLALNAIGYEPGSHECDALPAAANGGAGFTPEESYIPQEHAFADVVNNLGNSNRISPDELKTSVYDSLYREIMTSILYFVAESPLLKAVPNFTDINGDPMAAINFLDLNVNPRLIDMDSFSTQVAGDYSTLSACPDGLTEPPLYTALKTAAPRILARVYTVDITLRAIVPFSQLFFSEKDPLIKGLILSRLEQDINVFAEDALGLKAKIVEQYNQLAQTGLIDSPPIDEDAFESTGFTTAMGYFIEEEFNFVTDRIKEVVHGKCIPNDENKKETVKQEMYNAVMRYADLGDKNLKMELYAITKETATEQPKKLNDFSLESQLDEIDKIGTSFYQEYQGKQILLSNVEVNAEDLVSELGLDFDSIDCGNTSIYDLDGFTTETADHRHVYSIDENGNGVTTTTDGTVEDHTHAIYNYAIVPRFGLDGQVAHIHELVPRADQQDINKASVMEQVTTAMREKLTKTSSFKVLFDFSFDLNDVASLVMIYCLQSSDDQIMSRVFNNTKKQTITMFDWLWEKNQENDPCAGKEAAALALNFENMFPDMANAFLNPELLLMMLLAPLTTYKGWSKTADPHVAITSSIIEILGLPILPKNIKKNMPNLDPTSPNFLDMECINWPDFSQAVSFNDALFAGAENRFGLGGPYDMPATGIPAFALEGLVAGGVTIAPMIAGLPPFPPTPFGIVYYAVVSPLIWILKDLPRLQKAIQDSETGKRTLASTGLNVGPIVCEDQTPAEVIESGAAETVEDAEDCPPLREFQDTIIDAADAAKTSSGDEKEC